MITYILDVKVVSVSGAGAMPDKWNMKPPVKQHWALSLSAVRYASKNQYNYASEITGAYQ